MSSTTSKRTRLSELVEAAHRSGSVAAVHVMGEMGAGKTSYALWTAYGVYGDWGEALDHLFFNPLEALAHLLDVTVDELLEAAESGELEALRAARPRERLVVLDDAGLWLGRQTWWEPHKVRFAELFNVFRSLSAGAIFTSVGPTIVKPVALACNWRALVTRLGGGRSLARVYSVRASATMRRYVRLEFEEVFPTRYPGRVFEEYEKKRREAVSRVAAEAAAELARVHVARPRRGPGGGGRRTA